MEAVTVPARLVAAGVGLPAVWLDGAGYAWRTDHISDYMRPTAMAQALDLTDPQTAFGCALRLDAWERAGGDCGEWLGSWSRVIAVWAFSGGQFPQALAHRLRVIGMDHEIRRARGWDVQPGRLMYLYSGRSKGAVGPAAFNWYGVDPCAPLGRRNVAHCFGMFRPANPDEAREAIWREVCGG